jgi:hypothetical protein
MATEAKNSNVPPMHAANIDLITLPQDNQIVFRNITFGLHPKRTQTPSTEILRMRAPDDAIAILPDVTEESLPG